MSPKRSATTSSPCLAHPSRMRTIASGRCMPHYMALLVEAYGKVGQAKEGLPVLADGLATVEKTVERYYEAELYRFKGELLLQQSPEQPSEAEACFQQGIQIARKQEAKSWELRATTSLARLWQSQGKPAESHDLLTPVYDWFTEGFDTVDLKDAKVLLEELSESE